MIPMEAETTTLVEVDVGPLAAVFLVADPSGMDGGEMAVEVVVAMATTHQTLQAVETGLRGIIRDGQTTMISLTYEWTTRILTPQRGDSSDPRAQLASK